MGSAGSNMESTREVMIMITLVFSILLISVIAELLVLSVKLVWNVGKVLCCIIFFPVILIGLALSGFMILAIPVLLAVGIVSLVMGLAA